MIGANRNIVELFLPLVKVQNLYSLILMKTIICTALVIELFFLGCVNIEENLKIQGKVIDKSTKATIPSRDIILQGLVISNNKLVPIGVGQFSTDTSGYFSYSFKKIKDAYSYNFCLVGDSDYSFKTEEISLSYLKRNSKRLSFTLSKLADLTILIVRESKTPQCDTLTLSWKTDGVDGRTLFPVKINNFGLTSTTELKWIGGNVRSTVNTKAFADQWTIVRWVLYRNGRKKEILDTITCKRDLVNTVYLKY